MKHITKYIKNQHKDGILPVCPYCEKPYPDACYGEVKNYPDDGGLAVFMNCESCDEEAQATFQWSKVIKETERKEE